MKLLLLKIACLVIYAMALAGMAGWLPTALSGSIQTLAIVILVVHALELVLAFGIVRRYQGDLLVSVLLTLLFGLLHLTRLVRENRRS